MSINFCAQCGKLLTLKAIGDEGEQKYCTECSKFYFDNPASVALIAIINEENKVLLLRQNYISESKWVLCSGYVKKGETLEDTVAREALEETGQVVQDIKYVSSYYFASKNLIMTGFIAYVQSANFSVSKEVDALMWCELNKAAEIVERENNFSGEHLDNCIKILLK